MNWETYIATQRIKHRRLFSVQSKPVSLSPADLEAMLRDAYESAVVDVLAIADTVPDREVL